MSKPFLFILELLRIVIFLAIGFGVLGWIEQLLIYSPFKIKIEDYFLYYRLGNLLILFMFYRNVFQFKGWFKSTRNKKLSPITSTFLSLVAVSLIISPLIVK